MTRAGLLLSVTLLFALHPGTQPAAAQQPGAAALDYEVFKTKVQPILLGPAKAMRGAVRVTRPAAGIRTWSRCHPEARRTPKSRRGATSSASGAS